MDLVPPPTMTYEKVTIFVASIKEHVAALKANDEPVDSWSKLIAFILTNKLNASIRTKFERTLNSKQLPELESLLTFLNTYIISQQWQTVRPAETTPTRSNSSRVAPESKSKYMSRSTFVTTTRVTTCSLCKASHTLFACPRFQTLEPSARLNFVRSNELCRNCLSYVHKTIDCKSKFNCRICQRRHHTLLHLNTPSNPVNNTPATDNTSVTTHNSPPSSAVTLVTTDDITPSSSLVLLGTAIVDIQDSNGVWKSFRALLDSGSEATYITSKCFTDLGLTSQPTAMTISGLANTTVSNIQGCATIRFRPKTAKQPVYTASAIIINNITSNLPKRHIPFSYFTAFKDLKLADPNFATPAPVDMLIGADIYSMLLTGLKRNYSPKLAALETSLGWVVTGPVSMGPASDITTLLVTLQDSVSLTLSKFWELEEIPSKVHLSSDEEMAETLFKESHSRDHTGRYIVPLLFKEHTPLLGNSYNSALRCFTSLRNRFRTDDLLRSEYIKFMQEYLDTGHMSPIPAMSTAQDQGYFLPHHGVIREHGSTIKLRVVFNGSKKTSLNISLNDKLFTGPALQTDLAAIIMRSRFHRIMFTADIRHMYRQILIQESHRSYQKILWSYDMESQPQVYQLNTVTYGTSCAPFLALRTLRQLAEDEGSSCPNAARVLKTDTYVDDIITGANTLADAKQLQADLIALLSKAGLTLHKWASNHPDLLATVSTVPQPHSFQHNPDSNEVKILGIIWNPQTDMLSYTINAMNHPHTKRAVLSNIAKIFDPIGWLTPITMFAKLFMQQIWMLGTHWDAQLPGDLLRKWYNFQEQLKIVPQIHVPRFLNIDKVESNLLGFCDASQAGYAAVLYLHTTTTDAECQVSILCAKSRVAPLKRISLPRLELCAALLLSRLIKYFVQSTSLKFNNIYAWSDSSVALCWIRSPPYRWNTFVSNRVSEIQQNIPIQNWHHVRSKENPADCASRGILPQELIHHPLWWTGPHWLHDSRLSWPCDDLNDHAFDLANEEQNLSGFVTQPTEPSMLDRYSDLNRLLRITALCVRFINNLKRRRTPQLLHDPNPPFITTSELDNALLTWVRYTQQESFQREISLLERGDLCPTQTQRLNPFLDAHGLLRVGGRLTHARIRLDQKHPLLLPSHHTLTSLLIKQYHLRYLHPSPRTLQALLGCRFWILSAKKLIRSYTRKCVTCFRCRPAANYPLMGNLPEHRVTQLKPFAAVGVDYGGPFHITPSKGRGRRTIKAYLCLFVCFSTRALHLELASDLSTEAFLAAFRRFLARRGRCSHIYSDGGTNFIGAKHYFSDLQKFVTSSDYNTYLNNRLTSDGIQWHLNPPASPHFGGLWEAGIKSVKFHLQHVIGLQILTYEEFYTVLCQVECILNSRPLCPLSNDPNDIAALTPNHFLHQEAAVCLPEPNLSNISHLSRYQLLQKLQQDFWKRWHQEFLNTLQQRTKWHKHETTPQVGALVLIKDPLLPPLQWKLGRIAAVHPGADGIVRVADVTSRAGTFRRPVVKLCPLPSTSV